MSLYQRGLKRVFDVTLSLGFLIVFSPLLLLLSFLIRITLGSPVFFRQPRPGFHGKIFTLYKFRTMRDVVDAQGVLLSDADRLTTLGRLLRKWSLDELPSFLNVMKGEMSLVGPRPLLIEYVPRYSRQQMRRHEVMPGITGWTQIQGRNAISWDEKFKHDVWYVEHVSFWLDLNILFRTLSVVLSRKGIHAEGFATMPEFTGSVE
jgi:lipopolysaccharide/colanic/teichoic acid biosynthesis glycosyltransferase